jgi:5'-methylthioadenosine phosphorylase
VPKQESGNGFALIGGSMGFKVLSDVGSKLRPLGPVETPFGPSNPIHMFEDSGTLYMSRHGEAGYHCTASFVNYRANIWALKELGTQSIITWSGPAAIDSSLRIGEVLIPGDLVDETKRRECTFFNDLGHGFIRQNPTFCSHLFGALVKECITRFGACRSDSVYVCTEGPRLETAAEIRKFKTFGGDLVGMTLVPEVFLAKELEMCYAAICYITNYAEGVRQREFRPGVLFEGLLDDEERASVDAAVAMLPELALAVVDILSKQDRTCTCGKSMERYRRRGDIGEDWRTWITKRKS